jgi:DNA repair protein RecO (recombination protein O)
LWHTKEIEERKTAQRDHAQKEGAMKRYTTQAICLKAISYADADRIVTFYSPDMGRISAMVKGAKKAGSKLAGACELLSMSEVHLAQGRSMETLCQYQPVESFPRLRGHILKLAFAMVFAEQVLTLAREHDSDSAQVFQLLTQTLKQLEGVTDTDIVAVSTEFQLQLLNTAGYQPLLDHCVMCDTALGFDRPYYAFSSDLGGVVCTLCRDHLPGASVVNVSSSTLQGINRPHQVDWQEINVLKAQKFLHYYFRHKLERTLRSTDFLYELLIP